MTTAIASDEPYFRPHPECEGAVHDGSCDCTLLWELENYSSTDAKLVDEFLRELASTYLHDFMEGRGYYDD